MYENCKQCEVKLVSKVECLITFKLDKTETHVIFKCKKGNKFKYEYNATVLNIDN